MKRRWILSIIGMVILALLAWWLVAGTMTDDQAQSFIEDHQADLNSLVTILDTNPGICAIHADQPLAKACSPRFHPPYKRSDEIAYAQAQGVMRRLHIATAHPFRGNYGVVFVELPLSKASFVRKAVGVEWRAMPDAGNPGCASSRVPGWCVLEYKSVWWL